ncbi:MAG TPA: hypothetical protein VGD80_32465 [Kofleriaceae bacterium]
MPRLPVAAAPDDPYGSAVANGCYPLVDSHRASARSRGPLGLRVAHGDGLAARHAFE